VVKRLDDMFISFNNITADQQTDSLATMKSRW